MEPLHTFRFPPVETADEEGLLFYGADLSPDCLVQAYRSGIFPWYSISDVPFWYAPDPRAVLYPEHLHCSRSMAKVLRQERFSFRLNTSFEQVIRDCADIVRPGSESTWISEDFIQAYTKLHRLGLAHSAEAWIGSELAGGLYGVALGGVFFAESMFSRVTNASKAVFIRLVQHLQSCGYHLLDCQVMNPHLASLGVREISRAEFMSQLNRGLQLKPSRDCWPRPR